MVGEPIRVRRSRLRLVLREGDRIPNATVFLEDRRAVGMHELAEGPILLVFYLFDWFRR
jgi:hypothetical protein